MRKISNKRTRWIVVVLIIILLAAGIVVALHIRDIHKAQHTSNTIPTSKALKKSSAKSPSSKSQAAPTSPATAPSSTDNTKLPSSSPVASTVLDTPFGNFVSNHHPGQGGSPTSEESVCNTTPGATCDIQFTNGSGVTKDLGSESVNSNGAAYWSWNISGGTLAPGNWQITAVAKLNGQTKTASDTMDLVVSQ